jgi:hypothetical protein
MKKNKESINIYWAPISTSDSDFPPNQNLLYQDPTTLLKHWSELSINDKNLSPSFIKCPAFQNISKNTYVFNCPVDSSYSYMAHSNKKEDVSLIPINSNALNAEVLRDKIFNVGPSINLNFRIVMFSEEQVEIMLTGPYLNNVEYTKNGSLTSGQFDIGQWFRPIETEVQLYSNSGEIHFKKDEPLFYVKILTDKKINLSRFELTKELDSYVKSCVSANTVFGFGLKLKDYYNIFNKSRTRDIVLKKIKENLI